VKALVLLATRSASGTRELARQLGITAADQAGHALRRRLPPGFGASFQIAAADGASGGVPEPELAPRGRIRCGRRCLHR
jgi:hypothetical protein